MHNYTDDVIQQYICRESADDDVQTTSIKTLYTNTDE